MHRLDLKIYIFKTSPGEKLCDITAISTAVIGKKLGKNDILKAGLTVVGHESNLFEIKSGISL